MLRARIASIVIKAFTLAAALGVYAGFTLLLQWAIRSGGYLPTFLTVVAFFALLVRRRA